MKRKRILFFLESFGGGGAERVLLTILRHLDMKRYDVTVVVMHDWGVYSEAYHSLDINVVAVLGTLSTLKDRVKSKLMYEYLSPQLVARWIFAKLEADVYVAFVEGFCTKILSHVHTAGKKIAWVHIDLESFPWTIESGIYKNLQEETNAYKQYDNIVGVSDDVARITEKRYDLQKVRTLYNPIDEVRLKEMSDQPASIQIDKAKFNIISVGRLTKQKGYDELINLISAMAVKNPNLQLYIVGDGGEKNKLQSMIGSYGLNDKVKLTGFLENPYALMKDMDLFVCSSVAEGYSLVIAEAMTVGLPVVSMSCAGPRELLDNGKYGIICSSYEDLADNILQLSQDPDQLSEWRRKAKERASYFKTQEIIRTIERIL